MHTITLNTMQFYAHHGCFEEEQKIGTQFTVQLAFSGNFEAACLSDRLEDAVNYQEVYDKVKAEMERPSHLLENVARRIVCSLLDSFPAITKVRVEISKINPPLGGQIESVSVATSMHRKDYLYMKRHHK